MILDFIINSNLNRQLTLNIIGIVQTILDQQLEHDIQKMQQIDSIYRTFPNSQEVNLEYLNIRDITMLVPRLHDFKFMQKLSLHGNKLTYLPNLQSLRQLKQLDISNNPLKIQAKLLDSLFTIPNLQSLSITLYSQSDRIAIIQSLPKLKVLNEKEIEPIVVPQNTTAVNLKNIKDKLDIEVIKAKEMLVSVYTMLDQGMNVPDSSDDFHYTLKGIMQQFQYFYQNINNNLAKQCVYLYYKSKLYQVLDQHVINFLEDTGHQNISSAFEEVTKVNKTNFQQILRVCLSFAYQQDYTKKTLAQGNKLRKQTLYQNQITRLKNKIADLTKENQDLSNTNQKYIDKMYNDGGTGQIKRKNKKNIIPQPNQSKILTIRNMSNTKMNKSSSKQQMIRTPSKQQFAKTSSKQQFSRSPSKQQFGRIASKQQFGRISSKQQLTKTPSKVQFSNPLQKSNIKQMNNQNRISTNPIKKSQKAQVYHQIGRSPSYKIIPARNRTQQQLFQKSTNLRQLNNSKFQKRSLYPSRQQNQEDKRKQSHDKKLTLDQMIQFMDDFLYQKTKYNIQCQNKNQLFQTPQQFLYTYFLRKYGLKDIALEWSLLIIKAIQKFNNIWQDLKEQIGRIVLYTFEVIQIRSAFKDQLQSQVSQIFYQIFSYCQSQQLTQFLKKVVAEPMKSQKQQKCYKRRQILYKLQYFYMLEHQQQINKYLNQFIKWDKDQDGILEGHQVANCLQAFLVKYHDRCRFEPDYAHELTQALISRKKKGNKESMTFSEFFFLIRDYAP